MSRSRRQTVFLFSIVILWIAVGMGCKGFFVNQPNSMSVTTGPNGSGSSTFTVAQGSTVKLYATASFSSGNKDVTNSANWASSTPCATVSAGVVKGVGNSTNVTISATVGGVSGSATGSVSGGSGLSITSQPAGPTFTSGTTASFSANFNGSDVTSSTSWTSSDTNVVTFSSNLASFVGAGSATITGSYVAGSNCASGAEAITVQ